MCGIAGIHRLTDAPLPQLDRLVDALLAGIEERGLDATGYAAMWDDGAVQEQRASVRAARFSPARRRIAPDARTILLHTRWATQGAPEWPENNHPVRSGTCYVVHNGHINNDNEVFRTTLAPRLGEVDSEAIPAAVMHAGWENAVDGLATLEGQLAVGMIDIRYPRELILARGWTSPLWVVASSTLLVWASTRKAISDAWGEAIGTPASSNRYLELHEGSAIVLRDGSGSVVKWEPPKVTYRYGWGTHYAAAAPVRTSTEGHEHERESLMLVAPKRTWDYKRCDDCGDYFPIAELTLVGHMNELCPLCLEYAEEMGIAR